MKYLKLSAFLFPMVLLFACQEISNRDCSEIYCFTTPPNYSLQLIDKKSGADLITLKDLSIYDLKLYNKSLDKY